MKFEKGSLFAGLAILLFVAAIVIGFLILSGRLTQIFWFVCLFCISGGSMMLAQKNSSDAKKATEERHRAREERKNNEKNRYI